ncbi:hypothetical protein EV642_12168 [Kribbella sp. VKM Ac-2500]|jgi:hypothetical protein|uniref:hypothetical protein n=1 Tax=unclassified Kribbella TaxID=2644121 RepID=UPI001049CFC7|nr:MULTISPECIES: hypothetical protein [unclassified Kribbella]TCM38937.1 hypothetical protein EV648_11554 [Kribbella sp. VKM Ac-2568]TCN34431.1 hypothetical protein EV642_12168 [Kribbella sp. VKM Ac-2500]
MESSRATTRRHLPTSPFKPRVPDPIKVFEVGERVSHDKEGLGRISSVDGTTAVVVDFGAGRLLRVVAPFAKLHSL